MADLNFKVFETKAYQKDISKVLNNANLRKTIYNDIIEKTTIPLLKKNPYRVDSEGANTNTFRKLQVSKGEKIEYYRFKVGNEKYRGVYFVDKNIKEVNCVFFGTRADIYKGASLADLYDEMPELDKLLEEGKENYKESFLKAIYQGTLDAKNKHGRYV